MIVVQLNVRTHQPDENGKWYVRTNLGLSRAFDTKPAAESELAALKKEEERKRREAAKANDPAYDEDDEGSAPPAPPPPEPF